MISRIHRFHGRASLRFAYGRGQTVRGPHCSLKYVQNHRRKTFRVAVVVSRKVSKSAVVRNRIRRRVYEIVRAHGQAILLPFDLVFTIYDDQPAVMPRDELETLVVAKMLQAGILAS